jgi:hypothetical protein
VNKVDHKEPRNFGVRMALVKLLKIGQWGLLILQELAVLFQ